VRREVVLDALEETLTLWRNMGVANFGQFPQ
jgi:hypothetical protein